MTLVPFTVRLPNWLVRQARVVMATQGHSSLAHTIQVLAELGLRAYVGDRTQLDRVEAAVLRGLRLMTTTVAYMNLAMPLEEPRELEDVKRELIARLDAEEAAAVKAGRRH